MSHLVIGTAGHIDHGKTSLVKALTGIDTDRLKEEKQRGITIELGFAHLDLPGAPPLGIVDVPGHERFVHHMVAGVTGIDIVLLVVAADEGIMPQTREHLDICRLLGVRRGLVALTKADLVEPDWLEMVRDDVIQFTAGTFLEGSPIVPFSSETGEGLDDLKENLRKALEGIPARPTTGIPRLPVDRVFTMKGFGTVVTGTLVAGSLRVGDMVQILPSEDHYRIRGLQVHGRTVEKASAGQRTAVNLQGAEKRALRRGDTLTQPGAIEPSFLMDAKLQLLPSSPRPLVHRSRVRLHLGTGEILARVVVLGQESLKPGTEGLVQFRLESPGVALPRDRFVIRSYSPVITLGGGEMVDTHAVKHKRSSSTIVEGLQVLAGEDTEKAAFLLLGEAGPGGLTADSLARRLNIDRQEAHVLLDRLCRRAGAVRAPVKPPLFLHPDSVGQFESRCISLLRDFHAQDPLRTGLSKEELKSRLGQAAGKTYSFLLGRLQQEGSIAVEKDLVRLSNHRVRLRGDQERIKKKVEAYFLRVGLQPPVGAVIQQELDLDAKTLKESITLLRAESVLVKISEDLHIHAESISDLRDKVVEFLSRRGKISMQDFKEVSGLSRKYTIPIMEYFDRSGLTIRLGDHRVMRKTG